MIRALKSGTFSLHAADFSRTLRPLRRDAEYLIGHRANLVGSMLCDEKITR
jgi:hypothetical protein